MNKKTDQTKKIADNFIDRREVLKSVGLLSGVMLGTGGVIGTTGAVTETTLDGRFLSHKGDPISDARVAVAYRGDDSPYVWTSEDGYFETSVPPGTRVRLGFYKSSSEKFLAPRHDGVPHIYTLEPVTVPEEGYSLGKYRLPEAYLVNARAVFAEKPGGVDGAIPRFGSVRNGTYFASGYAYTTTNKEGYMELNNAGFTGIEMAGDTRIWMYPPTYEPYTEQGTDEIAPYQEETIREFSVSEDMEVEMDISRRKNKGKRKGKP